MIFGTGLDIIEIERIKNSIEKYSPKFEQRIFTSREISYCQTKGNPAKHFAARFAVKEAVSKCLGTGITGLLGFKDMEVINEENSFSFSERHDMSNSLSYTSYKEYVCMNMFVLYVFRIKSQYNFKVLT